VTNNFTLKLQIPKQKQNGKLSRTDLMINGISLIVWEQWMESMCQLKITTYRFILLQPQNVFSIVLMAVVNSNYEFIMADAGINGRMSGGGVLGNTAFGKTLVDKLLQIPEPGTLPNSEKKLLLPSFSPRDDRCIASRFFSVNTKVSSQGTLRRRSLKDFSSDYHWLAQPYALGSWFCGFIRGSSLSDYNRIL
jgi:hypothetical protein